MHRKHYNCAQKILSAFASTYETPQSIIDDFRKDGGGRAADGECGALFAAKYLLRHNSCAMQKIEEEFRRIVGETKCIPIRTEGKVSCNDCVDIAIKLLRSLVTY